MGSSHGTVHGMMSMARHAEIGLDTEQVMAGIALMRARGKSTSHCTCVLVTIEEQDEYQDVKALFLQVFSPSEIHVSVFGEQVLQFMDILGPVITYI